MQNRQYRVSPNLNVAPLLDELRQFFLMRDHQVQILPLSNGYVVQAQKESTLTTLLGQSSALTIRLLREATDLRVEIGNSKWLEKAAVGVVSYVLLTPLVILPIVGAFNQFKLTEEAWERIEAFLARSALGDAPFAPTYRAYEPPPAPSSSAGASACGACGATIPPGALFCSRCGARTAASFSESTRANADPACPQCGFVNQAGARFCSGCGYRFA
jgi:hypothetical protein